MRYSFLLSVLALYVPISYGIKVQLPNAQEIYSRLCEIGFEHFAQNTFTCRYLASKNIDASLVVRIITQNFTSYLTVTALDPQSLLGARTQDNESELNFRLQTIIKHSIPTIVTKLLNNYPEALEELKKNNLI